MLYRMKWETSGIMCVTVVVRMTPAPKHVRIVSHSCDFGELESQDSTVNKYLKHLAMKWNHIYIDKKS